MMGRMAKLPANTGLILIELGFVGAAWFLLGLNPMLGGALVAAVLLTGLVPERYTRLATGIAMLGVGGLIYFYFGQVQLGLLIGAFGAVMLVLGLFALVSPPRPPEKPGV